LSAEDAQAALPDVLADPRAGNAGQVQEGDRRCRRSCGEKCGTPAAVQARNKLTGLE
jgi:hypothetical protein